MLYERPACVAEILRSTSSLSVRTNIGLETSKPAVPDDQYSCVIAVNILRVGCVMNAVMGRSVHHRLQDSHPLDQLGMNPELVEQADGLQSEDHDGMESHQWHPQPENERKESTRPSLPQGRSQVVA